MREHCYTIETFQNEQGWVAVIRPDAGMAFGKTEQEAVRSLYEIAKLELASIPSIPKEACTEMIYQLRLACARALNVPIQMWPH